MILLELFHVLQLNAKCLNVGEINMKKVPQLMEYC